MISPELQALNDVDAAAKELADRNQLRLKEAIQKLGTKWLLHPANKITRISHPEPMLGTSSGKY